MDQLLSDEDIVRLGEKEKNKFEDLTLLIGDLWNFRIKDQIRFLFDLNGKQIQNGSIEQVMLKFEKNEILSQVNPINQKNYTHDFEIECLSTKDFKQLNKARRKLGYSSLLSSNLSSENVVSQQKKEKTQSLDSSVYALGNTNIDFSEFKSSSFARQDSNIVNNQEEKVPSSIKNSY